MGACAGLLASLPGIPCIPGVGDGESDGGGATGNDERLAVEELLQDAGGKGGYPVEITVECRNLPNKDKFSLSDPFVVVEGVPQHARPGDEPLLLGRTETIQDDLNPRFIRPVVVSFNPEEEMKMMFKVYHEAHPERKDSQQQLLGTYAVQLSRLVQLAPRSLLGHLRHPKNPDRRIGGITLTAQKIRNVQEEVILRLGARGLMKPKRGQFNTYVLISRAHHRKLMPVAKSNVAKRTRNPSWKAMKAKAYRLCANDDELPLVFQVYSVRTGRNPIYVGSCRATLAQLSSGTIKSLPLINEHLVGKSDYFNSGDLLVEECTRKASHSFLEYVRSGYGFNCTIAVDLSASNGGAIDDTTSLHFKDPVDPTRSSNDYMQVLRMVCDIVGRYDTDQLFPVYGFGAEPDMEGRARAEAQERGFFPISLDWNKVELAGADTIVRSYVDCLDAVHMVEPTNFAPIIRHVSKIAESSQHNDRADYQFLVILTDGQISDLTETIDAVVDASWLPMSVLLVGLGDPAKRDRVADGFEKCMLLDSGQHHSVITGRLMGRDIVSFVSYQEYKGLGGNEFARGTLGEVPQHFLSWIAMSGVTHNFGDSEGGSEVGNNSVLSSCAPAGFGQSIMKSPHAHGGEESSFARVVSRDLPGLRRAESYAAVRFGRAESRPDSPRSRGAPDSPTSPRRLRSRESRGSRSSVDGSAMLAHAGSAAAPPEGAPQLLEPPPFPTVRAAGRSPPLTPPRPASPPPGDPPPQTPPRPRSPSPPAAHPPLPLSEPQTESWRRVRGDSGGGSRPGGSQLRARGDVEQLRAELGMALGPPSAAAQPAAEPEVFGAGPPPRSRRRQSEPPVFEEPDPDCPPEAVHPLPVPAAGRFAAADIRHAPMEMAQRYATALGRPGLREGRRRVDPYGPAAARAQSELLLGGAGPPAPLPCARRASAPHAAPGAVRGGILRHPSGRGLGATPSHHRLVHPQPGHVGFAHGAGRGGAARGGAALPRSDSGRGRGRGAQSGGPSAGADEGAGTLGRTWSNLVRSVSFSAAAREGPDNGVGRAGGFRD